MCAGFSMFFLYTAKNIFFMICIESSVCERFLPRVFSTRFSPSNKHCVGALYEVAVAPSELCPHDQ